MSKRNYFSFAISFVLFAFMLGSWPAVCADNAEIKSAPTPGRGVSPPKMVMTKEDLQVKTAAKPFEVTGEVVDAWCYASQTMGPGRGERHKPCALACIMGGVTPGIVDDKGNLYICAKSQGYKGCQELLTPFVAKRVKAQGWLTTKGGSNVMKVTSVEEAK